MAPNWDYHQDYLDALSLEELMDVLEHSGRVRDEELQAYEVRAQALLKQQPDRCL